MRKFVENTKAEEKELTNEEISKYKDFGLLLTNYQQTLTAVHKKPLYKSKWGFLFILLIVLLVYLMTQKDEGQSDVGGGVVPVPEMVE